MSFIRKIFQNRKLILQLGHNDFRNRFANTSLGAVWGFIQPFIFMMTYVIVFQFILKTGSSGNDPFIVWYLPGMAIWQFCNEGIISASNSIRTYSYLVKKVVFPVDVIPVISMVSSSIVGGFLICISIVVCGIMGYFPNLLVLLYMLLCMYCFVISFTRFSSAVVTLVPDFSQLLSITMQLFFWFVPIIWNLTMMGNGIVGKLVRCVPFTYIVEGFRQAFLPSSTIITQNRGLYTIIFWVIVTFLFFWGNYVFDKNKKDFADVL